MNRLYAPGEFEMQCGPFDGSDSIMAYSLNNDSKQDKSCELVGNPRTMDRNKNQFLKLLAHEIRNPLASIKCSLDALVGMRGNEKVESLLWMMNRQVDQMKVLIDTQFDTSFSHCGKIGIHQKVSPLRLIINNAVEFSSTFIKESGQTLKVSDISKDFFVFADAERLTQVVSSLLNNATKYSARNSLIDLKVSVEGKQVVIRVRDNGIGISADHLKAISTFLNEVPDSIKRCPAGLGSGLTLVKALVELHRGTVIAESDGIGHGSVFTVRLPAIEKPHNTELI
jgi:signal transduction histidine kinase